MNAADFFARHAHNYSPMHGMCDWIDQMEHPNRYAIAREANRFVKEISKTQNFLYHALMARFGISVLEACNLCRRIYADWNNRHQILMEMEL